MKPQKNSKTILAIAEPTADQQLAIERGAWLAAAFGAELIVAVFDYDQQLSSGRFLNPQIAEASRRDLLTVHARRLEDHVREYRERGLRIEIDAQWGHPSDRGVLRLVAARQPLLVVKATHYNRFLRRAFFSNADWALVRRCSAPLLLVKPNPAPERPHIVAAVDPLHESDRPAALDRAILAFSTELASAVGGKLSVFHAYDPGPAIARAAGSLTSPIAVPARELAASVERTHRKAVRELLADYPVEPEAVYVQEGLPPDRLVATSRALDADFVVMGSVSRSNARRLLVGGTAERALDQLPCDLLVVKPPGFSVASD